MTITAQSIVKRCVNTLLDNTNVRWPANELARYFNDGQRVVCTFRPDAKTINAAFVPAAGAKQSLPAAARALIDITRNTSGGACTKLPDRSMLDRQVPAWYTLTGVTELKHWMYDPRDRGTFYVYPPAAGAGASLELVYSAYPTDIAEPADGLDYTAISGNMDLDDDTYANALADYILYRAYTKDAAFAGNAGRAAAHLQAFADLLKVEVSAVKAIQSAPITPPLMPAGAEATA